MAKDFSFQFYVNNWIGGVIYFTFEEKGAYLELLLLQFNHGKFTEQQIKHVLNTSYSSVWETIKCKFEFDGTFYWNAKMEEVKEERRAFTESRRNNRLGKTKQLTSEKEVKNTSITYVKHMEGESKGKDNSVVEKSFSDFWELYNKKVGSRKKCLSKWIKIKDEDRIKIMETLPTFLKSITDKKFQPHPETYLNNERWNDELGTQKIILEHPYTPQEIDRARKENKMFGAPGIWFDKKYIDVL